MSTKSNDRCLAKVDDDEPIFVLRAQDATAPSRVLDWINGARSTLSEDHLQEALGAVVAMIEWQSQHPERVKLPD
jgi:hypothetical protein